MKYFRVYFKFKNFGLRNIEQWFVLDKFNQFKKNCDIKAF
jgi:hypothetical protein